MNKLFTVVVNRRVVCCDCRYSSYHVALTYISGPSEGPLSIIEELAGGNILKESNERFTERPSG